MKSAYAPVSAVAIGVLLLVLSWLWPSIVGGANAYSEQDRQAFEQARTNLLDQMHSHEANTSGEHSEQAQQAAQREFDVAAERRDAALNRGQQTAVILKWIGIAFIVIGAVAHFALRST